MANPLKSLVGDGRLERPAFGSGVQLRGLSMMHIEAYLYRQINRLA
jgi:hypothetical protein